MRRRIEDKRVIVLWVIILIASLLKIWLLMRNNWIPKYDSFYDDYLQIKESVSIISGEWLGSSYDKYVLCKNPGFPLFVAACYFLRIPYPVGFGLLMCISAGFFVTSIKKIINYPVVLGLLYLIILYTPIFPYANNRIYRNALVPWVALIVISSLIYILYSEKVRRNIAVGIIGAISLGFFWILREDAIWFFSFILFALVIALIKIIRNHNYKADIIRILIPICIVIAGIPTSIIGISTINYYHYGIFTLNDRTKTNITSVMSDLYSIDGGENNSDVWLSHQALEYALENSPILVDIHFKDYYEMWAGPPNKDLKGDHVEWALRDAMESLGYYKDASATNDVYDKIHEELSQAFEDGRLTKKTGLHISSQTNYLTLDDFYESFIMSFKVLYNMGHYKLCRYDYSTVNYMDGAKEVDIVLWENVLGIEISRNNMQMGEALNDSLYVSANANLEKSIMRTSHINDSINVVYIVASYVMFIVSMIAYVVLTIRQFKKPSDELRKIWVVMTGLGIAGMTNIYAVVLFSRWINRDTTGKPYAFYAPSIYLLITIFMFLAGYYVVKEITSIIKSRKR